jgi:hypothetical protein
VTERDVFGNEIPSTPDAPRPKPAGPAEPSPRRGGTAAAFLVVALIVAGVVALVVVGLGGKDDPATTSSGAVITPQAPATTQQSTGGSATPPKPASLLRAGGLAAALQRLHGRGRLRLLRVAPDRVDAQLVTSSGALRNVQVTNRGALRDFGAVGSGVAGLPTIPFAQVDTRAPARMVRAAAARSGRSPSRVDYLVLLMLPTGQSWNLYFKPDGLHFAGDLHGSNIVRR